MDYNQYMDYLLHIRKKVCDIGEKTMSDTLGLLCANARGLKKKHRHRVEKVVNYLHRITEQCISEIDRIVASRAFEACQKHEWRDIPF